MDELFYIIFMAIFLSFFFALFFETMLFLEKSSFSNYVCLAEIYGMENSTGSSATFSLPFYDNEIRRAFCNA